MAPTLTSTCYLGGIFASFLPLLRRRFCELGMGSTFAPKRDLGFYRYCWMGFSASCTVLFLPTSLRLSYFISLLTAYVLSCHAGKAACIETRYTLAIVVAVHRSVSCKPLVSAEYNTKCTSFAMMQQCKRPTKNADRIRSRSTPRSRTCNITFRTRCSILLAHGRMQCQCHRGQGISICSPPSHRTCDSRFCQTGSSAPWVMRHFRAASDARQRYY